MLRPVCTTPHPTILLLTHVCFFSDRCFRRVFACPAGDFTSSCTIEAQVSVTTTAWCWVVAVCNRCSHAQRGHHTTYSKLRSRFTVYDTKKTSPNPKPTLLTNARVSPFVSCTVRIDDSVGQVVRSTVFSDFFSNRNCCRGACFRWKEQSVGLFNKLF